MQRQEQAGPPPAVPSGSSRPRRGLPRPGRTTTGIGKPPVRRRTCCPRRRRAEQLVLAAPHRGRRPLGRDRRSRRDAAGRGRRKAPARPAARRRAPRPSPRPSRPETTSSPASVGSSGSESGKLMTSVGQSWPRWDRLIAWIVALIDQGDRDRGPLMPFGRRARGATRSRQLGGSTRRWPCVSLISTSIASAPRHASGARGSSPPGDSVRTRSFSAVRFMPSGARGT